MSIISLLGKDPQDAVDLLGTAYVTPEEDRVEGERVYLEYPRKGISLILNERGLIFCVQLYGEGTDANYVCFESEVLEGVSLSSARSEVRSALGVPIRSSEGAAGKGLFGRYLFAWDKYDIDFCGFHFEYSEDLSHIRLVSIENANLGIAN
jgi:hypothetical protein